MHLIGWLSLRCLVVYFWSPDLFFHLGHFFLSWRACYVKGRSLRCSPGRGNACHCAVTLYVREGSKREQWRLLCSLPVFSHSLRLPQSNWAPLVLLPEWVGLCTFSAPVGVSPTNCPVRLGVSPAAVSTPTGVFNQWFEVLFPQAGALGCAVCFAPPPFLPVYLCENVGPLGLPPCGVC